MLCRSEAWPSLAWPGPARPGPAGREGGGAGPGTESRRGERGKERSGPTRPARLLFFSRARSRPRSAGATMVAARPARGSDPGAAGRAGAGRPRTAHLKRIAPVRSAPLAAPAPQDLPGRREAACSFPPSVLPWPSPVTVAPAWPERLGGCPRLSGPARRLSDLGPVLPQPSLCSPRPATAHSSHPRPSSHASALFFFCELLSVTSPGAVLGRSSIFCSPCPFLCCFLSSCCIPAISIALATFRSRSFLIVLRDIP